MMLASLRRRWRLLVGGLLVLGTLVLLVRAAWRERFGLTQPPTEPSRGQSAAQSEPVFHDPSGLEGRNGQALARTFAKLRGLAEGRRERVSIVQLGASHTAGQFFPDEMRRQLQARFGSAGRGFVAPGEPEGARPHTGVVRELEGDWRVEGAIRQTLGQRWGLTGVRAHASSGARITFRFCDECQDAPVPARLAVHYLERPGMGEAEVRVGNAVRAVLSPSDRKPRGEAVRIARLDAFGVRQSLSITHRGQGPFTLLGVSHELAQPGVVYDALGLSGSTAGVADGFERETFVRQLRARAPDLYVLFWGTNESVQSRVDPRTYERQYLGLLRTLRAAAPSADCLVLGPTDRIVRDGADGWRPAPSQQVVITTLRKVARTAGCAFWSPRAAMGGDDGMRRWQQLSWGQTDGTHLTAEGYRVLADMLVLDLFRAFDASATRSGVRPARATLPVPDKR
ncbi:MAG: GDSL-type esterase/lipase family protein [Myxococcaceae bacterium]|nr:GDSL-type esterase/lipase family protein [Myxococcaceae bacterium]